MVEKASRLGHAMLDPDTYVSSKTFEAALLALASAAEAVELALSDPGRRIFLLARPPGHHAGRDGAAMGAPTLGFCIFNVSALAAKLLAEKGHEVLVVDFDLHHGNGTQEIVVSDDPRIYHLDLHQDPATIYLGTGRPWQTGKGEAKNTKLNVVIPLDVVITATQRRCSTQWSSWRDSGPSQQQWCLTLASTLTQAMGSPRP